MARVLVIEDNPINLELMNYLLQAWQHQVLQAADGASGLALAARERPDLILCDLQMPGLDGHGVAQALRADPQLRHIPLLAVTAQARESDRRAALLSGYDAVFTKPIDPAVFMSGLQPYLPGPALPPTSMPPSRAAPAFPAIPPELRAPHSPCVLLTVDDGPSNVAYKRDLFEPAGYSVLDTDNVGDALRLLRRQPVDLVVSDVVMPDGGGFALLHQVRADPAWKDLPFVFLTSSARDTATHDRALAQGAQALLVRPIDAFELLATIRRALHRQSR